MSTVLYVTEPGTTIRRHQGRLRIAGWDGQVRQEIRLIDIERVVLVGSAVGLSGPTAACLLEAGIETAFLSSAGAFRGWLSPAKGRAASLRAAQFAAHAAPERRLDIARAIVARKIRNSDALLARYARNHPAFDCTAERARMASALHVVLSETHADRVDVLIGREGEAASAYFAAFGRMLGGGFSFGVRSRRPPADPANALLSFGYTLLASEATTAVAGAGLDPALGLLHVPQRGRPSLGLDLMEEFRQAAVDRLVLHIANHRLLAPQADFTPVTSGRREGNGFHLTPDARARFLRLYEERMTQSFTPSSPTTVAHSASMPASHPLSTCLREQLRAQARRLAHALRDDTSYHPFVLR